MRGTGQTTRKIGLSPPPLEWERTQQADTLDRQTARLRWQQQHLSRLTSMEPKRELNLVDAMEVTGGRTELLVLEDNKIAFLGTVEAGVPHGVGVVTYARDAERWGDSFMRRRSLEAPDDNAAAETEGFLENAAQGSPQEDLGRVRSTEDGSALAGWGELQTGTQYVGQVRQGAFEGLGVLCRQCGETYEGLWVNDRPEGYGIQRYPSGRAYLGEFRAGLPGGLGIMRFTDGMRVLGKWEGGACDGEVLVMRADGTRFLARQNSKTGMIAPVPPASKWESAVQKWVHVMQAVGVAQSLAREASIRARALESKLFPLVELIADIPCHLSDTRAAPPKKATLYVSQLRWLLDVMQQCRAKWPDPVCAPQRPKQATGEPCDVPPRERAYVAHAVEPIKDGRIDAWQFDLVAGEEKLRVNELKGSGLVRQYKFPSDEQASELVFLDGRAREFGTKLLRGGPELPPKAETGRVTPQSAQGGEAPATRPADVPKSALRKKSRLQMLQQGRSQGALWPHFKGGSRPSREWQLRIHLAQQQALDKQTSLLAKQNAMDRLNSSRSSRHVSQQRRTTPHSAQGPRETEYERVLRSFGTRISTKGISHEIQRALYWENTTTMVHRIRQELVAAEFQASFTATRIAPPLTAVPLTRGLVSRARTG